MPKQETAVKPRAKSREKMEEGESFECVECGLVVSVVDPCGCGPDACYITCCEQPMQRSKGSARKTNGRKTAKK